MPNSLPSPLPLVLALLSCAPLPDHDAAPPEASSPGPALQLVAAAHDPAAPAAEPELAGVAEPDHGDAEPEEAPSDGPLSVSVSGCAAAGCPLEFRFSQAIAEGALAQARIPDVTFEPPQEGRLRWKSADTLVFEPAHGSMMWGTSVRASIRNVAGGPALWWSEDIWVPQFQAAGKVASWPVIDGQPRFVDFLNDHTRQVGKGPLYLLYDQPVGVGAIARGIHAADANGRALRRRVRRPESVDPVWGENVPLENVLTVTLDDLPPAGEELSLTLPTRVDDADRDDQTYAMTVTGPLLVTPVSVPAPDRAPLDARWVLRFSNAVRAEKLHKTVSIEPAAPLEVSTWSGDELAIAATLQPGVRYRIKIGRGLTDLFGNKLENPLDLRVRAQDLPPSLEVPREALLLERGTSRLPVRVRNVQKLGARVFFLGSEEFVKALAAPAPASCETLAAAAKGRSAPGPKDLGALNEVVAQEIAVGSASRRALICAEVSAQGRGTEARGDALRGAVLAQISGLGLTAKQFEGGVLVWVTRLADGTPAFKARVTLLDPQGHALGNARAGEDGVAVIKSAALPPKFFAVAETADDTAVTEISDGRLSQAWQFGIPAAIKGGEALPAAVFTDRGVYRPEETVHIKAIVGEAREKEVRVRVQDPRGQQVIDQSLALDSFGAAALDLKLKPQAPVGEYSLRVTQGERTVARRFQVEEYRVPTFEVKVKTDESEWPRGEEIHAAIEAAYLHGGSLGGREVRYQVLRDREVFAPPAFPRFVFATPDTASLAGPVQNQDGKLDGAGRLAFSFKADHPASAGPMRYTVEASVTDVDRQAYAGRISRVVHPAAFYVGVLGPPRSVLVAGDTLEVQVAAVRTDGTALEGVEVRARLLRVDYHTAARWSATGTVQLMNRAVRAEEGECVVVSAKAPATCRFPLPEAGQFRLIAHAEDAAQQAVEAGFDVSVTGANAVAWPRFDQDRIEIVADKNSYKPGEIATLVVQTPFPSARGLLTLERDGVLEHRLFAIDGDTPRIEVPITSAHAPNVFASVVLVRGRAHFEKDASGFETGAPAFKIGYATLRVQPTAQALGILVRAPASAAPRGKLTIELAVTDSAGKPRAGQATLMVVDEAVLGMTHHKTPDPIAELYAARPLGVRTAESRLELPHARRARHEQIFPGGDGGEGFGLADFPSDLRNLFQSTAYWNPDVRVGADGRAEVTIDLPDNVTTYRIMAVVADGKGRAGSADRRVLVRKPLMVQAVVPRFAYPEDRMRVEALVFNGTDRSGRVQLRAGFEGLALESGADAEQARVVEAGGSATFSMPVRVVARANGLVRYLAVMDGHTDAVEVKLPILNPGSKRVLVAGAEDAADGKVTLELPADRQPGTAQMEVLVSTTSLTSLKGAVEYVMGYPNGCIEQTTSTAYPLVVLPDLLPEMGVTVNMEDLKKFSEAGVKRILSFQTTAGGLAYWPGSDEPHAFATAFGLTALIEAKKRGYDVPDQSLSRMADYLEGALKRGQITESIPHGSIPDGDTRALFVMTLGRLGRPQPAYVSTLWREKQKLTPFGLSFLAVAVSEMKGDQSLLAPILAEVRSAAQASAQEAWFDGKPHGGWSMGSPLRTHASALLAYAGTGARNSDMGGKLLTGLLKRQQYGMWGNTQENVFGIMGVVALATGPAAPGEGPKMELAVEGRPIREEELEKVSARVRRLTLGESDLALLAGEAQKRSVQLTQRGGPPAFLTVRATYEANLDEKNRAARKAGFEIARRYESLDGKSLDGKPVPLGTVVRVRVLVKSAEKQNYVAIDDKLPAGLEPMNAALATTEKVSQGKLSAVAEKSLGALSYSEIRDARVAFFVDEMPAGEYEYVYLARATTAGTFLRPAALVEAMYRPDVHGTTEIDEVVVK